MSRLSEGSYNRYKNCSIGDLVTISALNPDTNERVEFEGTVMSKRGATVKLQSDSRRMLEMRDIEDNETRDVSILLAVDGKEVSETKQREGENGGLVKSESTKLTFDYIVTVFDVDSQEQHIGDR